MSKTILLVEDNEDHAFLVHTAFKRAGCPFSFVHVSDGDEAIAYLKGEGQYADSTKFPRPSLMLLDLKMPRVDGFEVLAWIRQSREWDVLPVTVLTTSESPEDIARAQDLGANAFLTKPLDFPEFFSAVRQICDHWLVKSSLPSFNIPIWSPEQPPVPEPVPITSAPVTAAEADRIAAWEVPASTGRYRSTRRSMLVFHINDSTDDQVLFQAACKKQDIPFSWQVVDSSEKAIRHLKSLLSMDPNHTAPWPDLIVLDLHMPGGSGFEVLEFIRATPQLRRLPVVICSGNPDPALVSKAYKLGANSFLQKPVDFGEIQTLVASLFSFWSMMQPPTVGYARP